MTSENESGGGSVPVVSTPTQILCKNLLQGMHAAAQPLTILRASLGRGRISRMSPDEHRELAETSSAEIDRLCNLFNYLQQLVVVESTKPRLCAAEIAPLLEYTAEGLDLVFTDAGMRLKCTLPEPGCRVLIDSARTHQAVSSVLLIAHGVSRANDTIELIAEPASGAGVSGGIRVIVRNQKCYDAALNAERTLSVALAEANIRSQQGNFAFSLRPFCMEIELPAATLVQ